VIPPGGRAIIPAVTVAATASRKPKPKRGRSSGSKLFAHDRRLASRWVAGADEAGRGCLAGPLVAAAVLFDLDAITPRDVRALRDLNDSKQHTPETREELYPRVVRIAAKVHIVCRCARGIDGFGLHRTNLAALRDALRGVAGPGVMCLSDGFPLGKEFEWPLRPIVDGDAKSAAIAAASIVAKVSRDRFMHRVASQHPGWGFDEHVGYSTPEHRDAIRRLGVTPLHRRSFQSLAYQQLELDGQPIGARDLGEALELVERNGLEGEAVAGGAADVLGDDDRGGLGDRD
jgi:ribonuclease HII